MLNEEQDLLPVEQQRLTFYGKPIVVVRLPGGQPGVVLRFLCENLQIDTAAQTQRIRRTEAIAEDLVFAQVEEEVTNLIPEILERLGPQTLTSDHQRTLQRYVQHMHELTGKPYGAIYESLKTAFVVPKYADIPDQKWPRVVQWFRAQVEP